MDLAKNWRQRAARYRLEGQCHRGSGEVRCPPQPLVGGLAREWESFDLSGSGMVYSYSIVRQPPDGYEDQVPYILALVKLAEGPMVMAQLTDCDAEQVAIDMSVEMVTRRLRDLGLDGLIVYGYKFRSRISS